MKKNFHQQLFFLSQGPVPNEELRSHHYENEDHSNPLYSTSTKDNLKVPIQKLLLLKDMQVLCV
jgi:hypothetical protein